MTTTVFGDLPGVRAELRSGVLTNFIVGYAQTHILIGRMDPAEGSASPNEVEQIENTAQATDAFGEGSDLAGAIAGAFENGSNYQFTHGIAPEEVTVSPAETLAGGSGQLQQGQEIVEDESTITATNTVTGNDWDVNFVYESPPPEPQLSETLSVNAQSREVESGTEDDFNIEYAYLDWERAAQQVDKAFAHHSTGVITAVTESEAVAQIGDNTVDRLRPTYKLVRWVQGAQPNATDSDGRPRYNVSEYSDTIDNDAVFMVAPVRLAGSDTDTAIGHIGGMFAGHELQDPVYGDPINGIGGRLTQQLTPSEEGKAISENDLDGSGLRGEQVIPVRDDNGDGGRGITVEDNLSTYKSADPVSDWTRDYHRIRIADQVLLIAREIGETLRGRRLRRETVIEDTEQQIVDELAGLREAGLLATRQSQTGDSVNNSADGGESGRDATYDATITRTDVDEVSVTVEFVPVGVAKRIEQSIRVSQLGAAASAQNTA
jgi:hypothetical protein